MQVETISMLCLTICIQTDPFGGNYVSNEAKRKRANYRLKIKVTFHFICHACEGKYESSAVEFEINHTHTKGFVTQMEEMAVYNVIV